MKPCVCGHDSRQHELRSGGLLGCFISGCLCIDYAPEPDPALVAAEDRAIARAERTP